MKYNMKLGQINGVARHQTCAQRWFSALIRENISYHQSERNLWNRWALWSKEYNDALARGIMDRSSSKLLTGVQYQEMRHEHHKSPVIFHCYSQWLWAVSCPTHPDGGDNWCSKLNAGFLQLLFHLCIFVRVCLSVRLTACECMCTNHSPSQQRQSHKKQSDTRCCPGSEGDMF